MLICKSVCLFVCFSYCCSHSQHFSSQSASNKRSHLPDSQPTPQDHLHNAGSRLVFCLMSFPCIRLTCGTSVSRIDPRISSASIVVMGYSSREDIRCRCTLSSTKVHPRCTLYFLPSSLVNFSFPFQLPPTLSPNPQRRIVEQFKRALFAPQNSSFVNLKSEVKKVSSFSSPEVPWNILEYFIVAFFFRNKCNLS